MVRMHIVFALLLNIQVIIGEGQDDGALGFTIRGRHYSLRETLLKVLGEETRHKPYVESIINNIVKGQNLNLRGSRTLIRRVFSSTELTDAEKSGVFFWIIKLNRNRNDRLQLFNQIFSNLRPASRRIMVFEDFLELSDQEKEIRQITMDNIFQYAKTTTEKQEIISRIFRSELVQSDGKKTSLQFIITNTTYNDCLGFIKAAYKVSITKELQGLVVDIATKVQTTKGYDPTVRTAGEESQFRKGREEGGSKVQSSPCQREVSQWLQTLASLSNGGNKTNLPSTGSGQDKAQDGLKGQLKGGIGGGLGIGAAEGGVGIGGGLGLAPGGKRPTTTKGGFGFGLGGGGVEQQYGLGCGIGYNDGIGIGVGLGIGGSSKNTSEEESGGVTEPSDEDESGKDLGGSVEKPKAGLGIAVQKGPKGGIGIGCRGVYRFDNITDIESLLKIRTEELTGVSRSSAPAEGRSKNISRVSLRVVGSSHPPP